MYFYLRKSNLIAAALAGGFIGIGVALSVDSFAIDTEQDSEPRIFPYNGMLDFNGSEFIGAADFEFTLTDQDACTFTEVHQDVPVRGGRFAVNMGATTGTGVPDCVFDSSAMFIEVAVRRGDDNGAYSPLSGRQRIRPVPYAYWSAEGSDMAIDGNLTVQSKILGTEVEARQHMSAGGNLTVGGTTRLVGSLIAEDESTFEGHVVVQSSGKLHLQNTSDASLSGNGALVIGSLTGDNTTLDNNELQARNDGGVDSLSLNYEGGNVNIGGNGPSHLRVTGNTSITGNTEINGEIQGGSGLFRRSDENDSVGQSVGSTSGNGARDLGSINNRMCFLSKVEVDTQQGDTRFRCEVYVSNNKYYLDAGRQNSTDVECSARCLIWD